MQGFQGWVNNSQKLSLGWKVELRTILTKIEAEMGGTGKLYQSPSHWAAFCAIGQGVQEMSGYIATIQAFSDLIEQESGLFSKHWSELKTFTEKPSDSDDELADKIEAWLQQLSPDSKIVERYTDRLAAKSLLSATDLNRDRGLARSKSSPKPVEAKQNYQELLINTIQKNSPLSASPPPKD